MKLGDKVQVKDLATVEASFRGRIGTLIADSEQGDVVVAEFSDKDKAITHAFNAGELAHIVSKPNLSKSRKAVASK